MTTNMRPCDREVWKANQADEPTPAELIEHVATDLEYARKQLSNTQNAHTRASLLDCVTRAQDALDRVADVHAQLIVSLANPGAKEPGNGNEGWTVEERLAHAG